MNEPRPSSHQAQKLIKRQLEYPGKDGPLTQERIDTTPDAFKAYHSGRLKEVGDRILYGFLHEVSAGEDGKPDLTFISFVREEIGVIYVDAFDTEYSISPEDILPHLKAIA